MPKKQRFSNVLPSVKCSISGFGIGSSNYNDPNSKYTIDVCSVICINQMDELWQREDVCIDPKKKNDNPPEMELTVLTEGCFFAAASLFGSTG
jgi:hypothetical protein